MMEFYSQEPHTDSKGEIVSMDPELFARLYDPKYSIHLSINIHSQFDSTESKWVENFSSDSKENKLFRKKIPVK